MQLMLFICFTFLVLDFVVFSVTRRTYKSYKNDIKELTCKIDSWNHIVNNLNNCYVAVDYRNSKENPTIVHEYCTIFLDKKTGAHIIVPDSLYDDYSLAYDYDEL